MKHRPRARPGVLFTSAFLLTLGISACGGDPQPTPVPLVLDRTALPDARFGEPYSQGLTAKGGTLPYRFEVTAGALPEGLTLSGADGRISGTPSEPGPNEMSVTVTDAGGASDFSTFSIYVEPDPLRITTTTVPAGSDTLPYFLRFEAEGGVAPLTWSLASGRLPNGLTLETDGRLRGTPDGFGVFAFEVKVTDAEGEREDTASFMLLIESIDPMISTSTVPDGRAAETYFVEFRATEGTTPYTWSLSAGTLPAGLTLRSSGVLDGVPTQAGLFQIGVHVEDSVGRTDETMFTIRIVPALLITSLGPPQLVADRPVSYQFEAAGGVPPYTWALGLGSTLPSGLSLDADGLLSGSTSQLGQRNITIVVTDALGFEKSGFFLFEVSDRFVYAVAPGLDFPPVCTSTSVSYATVEIEVTESMQIEELDIAVDIEFTDEDEGRPTETRKLKLVLWAPDGTRSVLCGNGAGIRGWSGCDRKFQGPLIQTSFDTNTQPDVPLSVFDGMNPRGTWKFTAIVVEPELTFSGLQCKQNGIIRSIQMSIRDDRSSDDYVRLEGFTKNNLIIEPWVRIQGGGIASETSVQLDAQVWSAGANGVREGGQGDDVMLPTALVWSSPNCTIATVNPDGLMESNASQNTGFCDIFAAGGGHNIGTFLRVIPPDWNPLVRQY